jgi:chemotaxis protein CheD
MAEIIVKMGDLAVSTEPGAVLASIGLGSCMGVALVSRTQAAAGLAHVMLPETPADRDGVAKYADFAVPALVRELTERGAPAHDLDAVLVGGAQMFSFDRSTLDVGVRNERAVRAALSEEGIAVRAAATAGKTGRTIRVHVESGIVTCKEAGGTATPILEARPTSTRRTA